MKKNKLLIMTGIALTCISIFSCEKENTVENIPMKQVLQRSDEYYANLRAYKKSDHQIYYGWFGGTGGEGNPNSPGVLDNIPDSVDIVSLWGGAPTIGSYNDKVLKRTQELKGTRFVSVFFPNAFDGHNLPDTDEGIKQFAAIILKGVEELGLDGVDIDYESHVLSIFRDDAKLLLLIQELSKKLGPKSGTDKLLIMDTFVERLPAAVIPYLSYYVVQAYSPQGGTVASLPARFNQAPGMPYEKCIATENFEAVWQTGGLLLQYAAWNPVGGRKGGVGAYHPEYEYPLNPDYKYTRQAIQIMNPAVK